MKSSRKQLRRNYKNITQYLPLLYCKFGNAVKCKYSFIDSQKQRTVCIASVAIPLSNIFLYFLKALSDGGKLWTFNIKKTRKIYLTSCVSNIKVLPAPGVGPGYQGTTHSNVNKCRINPL